MIRYCDKFEFLHFKSAIFSSFVLNVLRCATFIVRYNKGVFCDTRRDKNHKR